MALSRFVDDAEYAVILERTSQVISAYSHSSHTSAEASIFLQKIAEKCKTREEYLKVVEQRLDLLSDPNKAQEHVDWFKDKRQSLVNLLQGIKQKLTKDKNYLSKYSSSFGKGLQCLDQLLKIDANQLNASHFSSIVRVKKLLIEVKEGAKVIAISHSERYFLYDVLFNVVTAVNVDILLDSTNISTSMLEIVKKQGDELKAFISKWHSVLDAEYKYRLQVADKLIEDCTILINKQKTVAAQVDTSDSATAVSSGSAVSTDYPNNIDSLEKERTDDLPSLDMPMLYSVLCDLKEQEWHSLLKLHRKTSSSAELAGTAIQQSEAEHFSKASKKRKAVPVSIEGASLALPASTQKVVDQLQQYSVGVEASAGMGVAGRSQHVAVQEAAAEKAILNAPWQKVLDLGVFSGFAQENL